MKKTVIKCTSRADWGRIIQWAEEITPNCTKYFVSDIGSYYGFNFNGDFGCWITPPSDYTVLELSDFIAYPVKKEMLVSDSGKTWVEKMVVGKGSDRALEYTHLCSDGSFWRHAKPINSNQEEIDEIDKQIAELTKRREELL